MRSDEPEAKAFDVPGQGFEIHLLLELVHQRREMLAQLKTFLIDIVGVSPWHQANERARFVAGEPERVIDLFDRGQAGG
ncbi:hypothetical protein CBA19CS22_06300 [Caballeronia novacaledonica]|uniref:Uncharacterized protein n=1 Tax=Caballeronia novacaledonica TaxID=1544861 RepID=A0ACB5QM00_9BURK|nr:hypothetical protein CBA19CS22_06300 [Caballeronia novacaledonica]